MKQWSWTASMVGVLAILLVWLGSVVAWEPQKPVELIIPAGPGGGADVMARFIAPLISKHNLSPQPFVAVNKSGGAGAEGFLYVKGKHADPHVIVITLSNLFTTPLATGTPFTWKDLTPLARLALDEFILWVHAETPYTYPATALYLAFYMRWVGQHRWPLVLAVSICLPLGSYFLFDKWFMIPMPKGLWGEHLGL